MNPQGNRNTNYSYYVSPYFQPPRIDNMTMNFHQPGNYSVLMDFNPCPDAVRNAQLESRVTDVAVVPQGQGGRQFRNGSTVNANSSMGTQAPPSSPINRIITEQNINSSTDVVSVRSPDQTGSKMTSPNPPSAHSPLAKTR